MTALLTCYELGKSYGARRLFHNLSFTVHERERIGIIGPNGTGKSTFLKVLAGSAVADEGQVTRRKGVRVAYVPQHPQFPEGTVEEVLFSRLEGLRLTGPYDLLTQVRITLGKMGFEDPGQKVSTLSGGWLKRLALAEQWAFEPELVLLDEPTNHLDLETILWLERLLQRAPFAYIVISHDRRFLEEVSERVIEMNPRFPSGFFAVDGPYSLFLEKRETFLEGQLRQEQRLRSKLRKEVEWLRRQPKARATKSRSRVEEAQRLQVDLGAVKSRNTVKSGKMGFSSTERRSKRLLVGKNLSKTRGGRCLFSQLDITLSPGTRLGIVGGNGSGKSSLLRVLAGEIESDTGTLKWAEGLRVVVFDQQREQLPQEISLREALCPSGETVHYREQSIHVNAWAARFLFEKERLDLPVKQLSGGEQARVLIARLMLQPADLLFLDEPTNDLDIPTLELLEESLLDFEGALVLITHDRLMLDQVSTELIALGEGLTGQYFADSSQWAQALESLSKKAEAPKEAKLSSPRSKPKVKLSYKEKKELEGMEEEILALEEKLEGLQGQTETSEVMGNAEKLFTVCQEIEIIQAKLEARYRRWQELEDREAGLS